MVIFRKSYFRSFFIDFSLILIVLPRFYVFSGFLLHFQLNFYFYFQSENQENSQNTSNVQKSGSSPNRMRSRSPLAPIELNKPNKVNLRESWQKFRDFDSAKKLCKPDSLWKPFSSKTRPAYQRDSSAVLLSKHSSLTSRMRIILLDWLIEVCEVYRLHRETFYLATDFFDRYMTRTVNIQKTKLQLIGKF